MQIISDMKVYVTYCMSMFVEIQIVHVIFYLAAGIGDLDDFGTLPETFKISDREVEKMRKNVEKTKL